MNTIEEFFKNSISFTSCLNHPTPHEGRYVSNNIFKPEDYSNDFLKEKIKSFCYFLYSNLDEKNGNWNDIEIYLSDAEDEDENWFGSVKRITRIFNNMDWTNDKFLWNVDRMFDEKKTDFCYAIPSKPFKILIEIVRFFSNRSLQSAMFPEEEEREDEREEEREEESEEEEPIINAGKTFKSNECVICITNSPNVLFCNCGHLSVCVECDKVKSLKTWPVCKTENTIKRIV